MIGSILEGVTSYFLHYAPEKALARAETIGYTADCCVKTPLRLYSASSSVESPLVTASPHDL